MSQLQLSLLGEPLVKHGEMPLAFSTRKALALLVYLAVEGGLHTRKALSEAFWPELDARHGRAALRATLLELRRLFERAHRPGEPAHLRNERDLLGIAQDSALVLDLRVVEAASKLAGRGGVSLDAQARDELLEHLEQASRLVRGPFLAGFTLRDSQFFDDWSTQHREYWHRCASQVFDTLSALNEQGGEVERAIKTVSRWLRFDPLAEEGYRRLMRLRFAQGDRVGALRAYSRCRTVLAEAFQVEPEPETRALAKHMRYTAPLHPGQALPAQPSAGQPPANLLDGPFLGRSAEFGTLIDRYQRARAGQPQVVLLQGEAGIGKTRLANEFAGWAQAQGAEVLIGRTLPTGHKLAYQPLIDILRCQLEHDHALTDLGSPIWLAELARLLPELRERYPDLPAPPKDEALGHTRLFEAIARLVQKWTARHPLVLLLDDLQWANPAMFDLLLYLGCRLTEQPVPLLLLLNLKTEPGGCTTAQANWMMALKRTGLFPTELQLTPFSREETRRFVQRLAWAEQPVDAACKNATGSGPVSEQVSTSLLSFADWLYSQTSGQPLYLVETLKELMARGIMSPSLQKSGTWGFMLRPGVLKQTPEGELISQALRELINFQIARLSPSAWTLLATASALEAGLSFERLCQVAGLDELEGVRAVEELLHDGWLSEATSLAGSPVLDGYAFRREMMRKVVYQEAGATRRRIVQRRLAALIREGVGDDLSEDARAPHPTAADKNVPAGKSTAQELHAMTGTMSNSTGGLWKTRKEEHDARHATHTATYSPGASNSGRHPDQTGSGGRSIRF